MIIHLLLGGGRTQGIIRLPVQDVRAEVLACFGVLDFLWGPGDLGLGVAYAF